MALKDTVKSLKDLLMNISHDLEKSDKGNKAASQRVRTGTVKLEKVAKLYRKESIKSEKQTKGTKKTAAKKPAKPVAKAAAKSAAKPAAKPAVKPAAKKPAAKPAPAKSAKVKAKAKPKAHTARARAMSFKKPTAKLPTKRAAR